MSILIYIAKEGLNIDLSKLKILLRIEEGGPLRITELSLLSLIKLSSDEEALPVPRAISVHWSISQARPPSDSWITSSQSTIILVSHSLLWGLISFSSALKYLIQQHSVDEYLQIFCNWISKMNFFFPASFMKTFLSLSSCPPIAEGKSTLHMNVIPL